MNRTKIISLEFNELCPELLARWMSAGELPNFRRFFEQSHVITAVADEPGPDNLEPWIQWYSMHTGLPYRRHGVQHLTDGPTAAHDDIWQILSKHGLRVANCGSMNARHFEAPGSLFLPDPWCTSQTAYPRQWDAYHRLIASFVQENSRSGDQALRISGYAGFAWFVVAHGLRPKTAARVASQVFSDTVLRRGTGWRRAALLDKLQFDVFRHYWKRQQPQFATFFLNSTAHYQHAYWHCAFPDQFDDPTDPEQLRRFGNAILYGYKQMDGLLAEFFELERDGAMLMLCTALSQQSTRRSAKVYYRFRNIGTLLASARIQPAETLPVMSEQFNLRFAKPLDAMRAREVLGALRLGDEPLLCIDQRSADSVFIGTYTRRLVADDALVTGFPDGATARFGDILYRLPTTKATVHHPESLMWIKSGTHRVHDRKVSILDWLPTVLDFYGINLGAPDLSRLSDGQSFLPILEDLVPAN